MSIFHHQHHHHLSFFLSSMFLLFFCFEKFVKGILQPTNNYYISLNTLQRHDWTRVVANNKFCCFILVNLALESTVQRMVCFYFFIISAKNLEENNNNKKRFRRLYCVFPVILVFARHYFQHLRSNSNRIK